MTDFQISQFFDADGLPDWGSAMLGEPGPPWILLWRMDDLLAGWGQFINGAEVHPDATVEGDVHAEEGVVIEAGAYVQGPVILGKGTVVRHGAYVRGHVVAGEDCVIGHATEVKHSLMLNHSKAAHFAYLGDCILGKGVNLGAGTKCANFKIETRPDREVLITPDQGDRIRTGLRKLGAIIGDGVELGCNSVTMPGTLIGKGTLGYPNLTLRNYVPAMSIIKPDFGLKITPRRTE